ncbi:MAG TPA: hypothetical protein GXX75_09515 [Clostridiales bacterium]|nr:hypothetical protein [Clostridiales bacterium]
MSENKNYDDNIEIDEMKIRFHLNDSLDLSGISVSEDLIHRTLLAIKNQPEMQEAPDRKVIPWNRYFRALAGVAAAVVVVVAGYGLASNGVFSGQKTFSRNDQAYDTSAPEEVTGESMMEGESGDMALFQTEQADREESALNKNDSGNESFTDSTYGDTTDNAGGTQDADGSSNGGGMAGTEGMDNAIESPKYSIVAEVPTAIGKAGAGEAGSSPGSSGTSAGSAGSEKAALSGPQVQMSKSFEGLETVLSFREIFLADPAKASSLTVTDEINKVSVVLTSKEDILSFYTLMEQHQFTYGNQTGDTSNYTIEIVTPSPSTKKYTMYVGDGITVDYTDEVTTSHNAYTAGDPVKLSTDIQEFCRMYGN